MATLLWRRQDIGSGLSDVTDTYSTWDKCMTEAYCKWPAIVGIILAVILCLSILWCCIRCLCCGAECCCGCLACCNSCCPSPRGGNKRDNGYYQQPPPQPIYQQPYYQQPYPQYQSAPPPIYASGGAGYRGTPQTAMFDTSNKNGTAYNEDALPPMPSWSSGQDRRVDDDDVELEKMNGYPQGQQQQSLLPQQDHTAAYYGRPRDGAGDLGTMHASPYQDYDQYRQTTSPTSMYPPTYHTSMSPVSAPYEPPRSQWGTAPQHEAFAASRLPSYHTAAPSITSPPPHGHAIGRKPVQGSWRDV